MLLSDGIRLGAAMKPQAFGWYNGSNGGTCALGGAFEVMGVPCDWEHVHERNIAWQVICDPLGVVKCRDCEYSNMAGHTIVHMNDGHRISREEIADVVESWEVKAGLRPQPVAVKPAAKAGSIDPLADIFSEAECDKETVRCV